MRIFSVESESFANHVTETIDPSQTWAGMFVRPDNMAASREGRNTILLVGETYSHPGEKDRDKWGPLRPPDQFWEGIWKSVPDFQPPV